MTTSFYLFYPHMHGVQKKIIFIFAQLREKLTNFSKKFRSTHGAATIHTGILIALQLVKKLIRRQIG